MTMQLTSPAFQDKGMIPAQYSCDGKDVSPALAWSGAPGGTQSFALICDDPDAPNGDWVHWVLYDLPATVNELSEAYPRDKEPGGGAKHGLNSWRRYGYGGPCPPSGTHRYFFKLYALDCQLGLPAGKTKTELLDAMKDHVLAETQLMGRYKRH
ncbi:YbhB/YbcL family Raf kinase inhibitor-like protein [Candidatus Sumerlaeota bacterium]|nr:YbhB/YbcL family Raf kinase inhibitor-like protein [Candidatus Sumerlaeota bacterium]